LRKGIRCDCRWFRSDGQLELSVLLIAHVWGAAAVWLGFWQRPTDLQPPARSFRCAPVLGV
jgi:hypothetical protein